ncbi:expansin EXLX1 family cellulose-binding protein [Nocardia sp. NPDC127579]|uniref:expansin EXLX1 family cellulose-binding protein n=1 Tax=Nocardia sp. NPDC127579 TaxID=3345402 RepID=UPI00363ED0D6
MGVLLAVVGLLVWVARPESTPCAATGTAGLVTEFPTPPSSSGIATMRTTVSPPAAVVGEARYFRFAPGVACSFPDLPVDGYYAGVSTLEYGTADLCGAYLDVHGPNGAVRVLVADHCPGCAPGQLDLSAAAFAEIADPAHGVADIRYRVVHNPDPAPEIGYEIKADSSETWLAILFTGTGNPLRQVSIRSAEADAWLPLVHTSDNHWTITGAGAGPFGLRLTDIHNQATEIHGLTLTTGVNRSGTSLYTITPPPPVTTPAPVPRPSAAPLSAECAASG